MLTISPSSTSRRPRHAGFSLISVLLVLALAGATVWWFWLRDSNSGPSIAFNSAPAAKGDVIQAITATGDLQPVIEVEVSSQISGLLIDLYVDFNDRVNEGDVLARIDPATFESRLASAQAELVNAEANHKLATLNHERVNTLFERNLVSLQEVQESDAKLAQASAQLLTRGASVANAETDLARCTIYAPITGIVIDRLAEVGKTVAASLNAPTLFTIVNDLRKMEINAYVSEADIGSVADGQTVNFTVDAYPDRTFRGEVTQIRNSPQREQSVIVYSTIIDVDNADMRLKPGMTANVSIVTASAEDVVRVPNSALRVRVPEGVTIIERDQPNAPAATATAAADSDDPRAQYRALMQEAGWSGEGRPDQAVMAKVRELAEVRGIEIPQRGGGGGGGRGQGGGGRGQGGGGGGGGDGERRQRQTPTDNRPTVRTLYRVVADAPTPTLESFRVTLGITDGSTTQVIRGLEEGEDLVTGLALSVGSSSTATNPFATTRTRGAGGGGGGGGPRGGGGR